MNIRDLYPHYTPEQLQEAEERLTRYVTVLLRIHERLCREEEAQRRATLTAPPPTSTMNVDQEQRTPT